MKTTRLQKFVACAGILSLALAKTFGATPIYYWDNNKTSTPGDGVWDTTSEQWASDTNLTDTPLVWDTTAAAAFPAGGTMLPALNISVNSDVSFSGIFNGLNPAVGVTNLVFSGSGTLNLNDGLQGEYTGTSSLNNIIRVPITGSGKLQHNGSGSLFLSATNTFTGGFSFGSSSGVNPNNGFAFGTGPVTVDASSMILAIVATDKTGAPFATAPITFTNSFRAYNGNGTWILVGLAAAPVTFTGPITLADAGNTTTLDVRNTDWTIASEISGGATLSKKNTANLILSGTNTYSGGTVIQNGTVIVDSINSVVGGTAGSSLGAPTDAASGTIHLGTTTTAGTLLYQGDGETSDRIIDLAGTTGGATIQHDGITGPLVFTSDFTATGSGAKLLTLQGSNTMANTVSGVIPDSAGGATSLTKAGLGKWTLSGANTFSGAVKVSRGSLIVSSINSVSGGSPSSNLGHPTTVANGTISLGNSTTQGILVYTGSGETSDRVINLSATTASGIIQSDGTGPLVFTSNATATGAGSKTFQLQGTNTSDNTFAGKIVNNSAANITSVTKAQAGTWVLSGANTFSGNLSLSAGLLKIANAPAMGLGGFVISGNGSFENASGADLTITNALTLSGGSPTYLGGTNNITFSGPVTISGANRTITVNANTMTLNNGIGDSGQGRAFTKAGAGTLNLLGANTYTGNTTVSAGTLALGASASLASTGTVTIGAGATLDVSAIPTFSLTSSTLSATTNLVGGPSIIKGGTTVDLGTKAISLTYKPTAFSGDTGNPALTISQGTLSLSGNAFTVNNASGTPLAAGTYQVITQASGDIASSGTHTVTVTGAGLTAGSTAEIQVTGNSVNLVVSTPAANATISTPMVLGDGTISLNFTGTPGANYFIESTTNLTPPIVWTALSTNTADETGAFNFIDTDATNNAQRFYRAETQQP
jgi:autotransporter-associated beta strand protein